MEFKYIDIHSHLNLHPLDKNQEAILAKMKELGVATITVGVDYETSAEAVKLANENEGFYACVGLHPNDLPAGDAGNMTEVFDKQKYTELARDPRVVAIGETGLDYFRDQSDENKKRQKEIFIKHIEIAIELGKPLMIHSRASRGTMDAYTDTLEILKEYKAKHQTLHANFHFFAGDMNVLDKIVMLDFSISVDGPITFTNDYNDVIKNVPLDLLMAETDAPFAAPVPHRGKTCEPWMVTEVYRQIANIRGEDQEKVREQINQNARRIFKLD